MLHTFRHLPSQSQHFIHLSGAPEAAQVAAASAVEIGPTSRLGKWLVKPDKLLSIWNVPRLPLMAAYWPTYGLWTLGKGATQKGVELVKSSSYYEPAVDTAKVMLNVPKAGYHMGPGVAQELVKGFGIRLPKYALHDNVMTGFNALYNIPAAAVTSTANAVSETAKMPFRVAIESALGVKNVLWDAPKELLARNYRGALKTALEGKIRPYRAAFQPVKAIANVPYKIGSEVAITAVSYGANAYNTAMVFPKTPINMARRFWHGVKKLDNVREIFRTGTVEDTRGRIDQILKAKEPLAFDFNQA